MNPKTQSPDAPLLVELVTEELPPKALGRLASSFAGAIAKGLLDAGLATATPAGPLPAFKVWATPRRIGVTVESVGSRAGTREVSTKGPSIAVALDASGKPSMALTKWALKQGVDIARDGLGALTRATDGKQDCFFHVRSVPGATLAEAIGPIIAGAIAGLPIPKRMNYQLADGETTVSFVRPAHRLVVLHGDTVVPASVLGLEADRISPGHRFLGAPLVELAHADDYEARLRDAGRVVVDFDLRRAMIDEALQREAAAIGASLALHADDLAQKAALLDEVTALVEWPTVLVGHFDEAFLAVPPECLILTMRTNQKFFPLFGADGLLLPRFLIVSNMAIDDPSRIIDGNERVVRPRLADARFFFEQDRKARLDTRMAGLDKVVYHAKLGTQAQRSARVAALAGHIATRLAQDPVSAKRAAMLAKADLLTGMVGEFPELQGIMGRYYARHDGEAPDVADAIAEHYRPRFAGDALPVSTTGTVLALADKLETLAGIWGIGQHPSGDRDPFALRRHALGVVRLLIEKDLPLPLTSLITDAFSGFVDLPAPPTGNPTAKGGEPTSATGARPDRKPDNNSGFVSDTDGLWGFVIERLKGYLRERGFEAADIDAVVAVGADRLDRIESRLEAVRRFRDLPQAQALAAANKRIANILRKAQESATGSAVERAGAPSTHEIDSALLVDAAEIRLHHELAGVSARLEPLIAAEDYESTLLALASLREPVDAFFDEVMVNAEDPAIRANRLALLGALHRQMNRVADLSRLHA